MIVAFKNKMIVTFGPWLKRGGCLVSTPAPTDCIRDHRYALHPDDDYDDDEDDM